MNATHILRAEIADWRTVAAQLTFPDYLPASGSLSEAVAHHNQQVAKFRGDLQTGFDAVDGAMASADAGDYGQLVTAIDQSRIDRGAAIQELARLWANRIVLAEQAYTEFTEAVRPVEDATEKEVERVTAAFTKIGSGAEAMPSHGIDGKTAEAQLRWLVRYRNVHTAKAFAALQNAKAHVDAAAEQIRASKNGQAAAHDFIMKMTRKLVAA